MHALTYHLIANVSSKNLNSSLLDVLRTNITHFKSISVQFSFPIKPTLSYRLIILNDQFDPVKLTPNHTNSIFLSVGTSITFLKVIFGSHYYGKGYML